MALTNNIIHNQLTWFNSLHKTYQNGFIFLLVLSIASGVAYLVYYRLLDHRRLANIRTQFSVASAHKEKQALLLAGRSKNTRVGQCLQGRKDDNWKIAHHPMIPNSIFISVASYRDDECKDTVFDLFDKAKNPTNIYVGVVQQNKEKGEDCFDKCEECSKRKESGHIRVKNFSFMEAKGPTFARYHCSKLWRGEEFYLQIDSHIKFEKNWDETLLNEIKSTGDKKAVIGCYPPTEKQMKYIKKDGFKTMISMCGKEFDKEGMPSMQAALIPVGDRKQPVPVHLMSAGLICFPGRMLYEVPYDPFLSYLFFGEELLFSTRLWTAGYNMYAPLKSFCSHHYGREGKPKYWTDHPEAEGCRKHALQRAKYILGVAEKKHVHPDYLIDVEKYGMGKKRTLEQYFKAAGIDMKRRTIKNKC